MKHKITFITFLCVVLAGTRLEAQVRDVPSLKDMPSQAEFDPILDNADNKLKDFIAILTKYRTEASAIDSKRLEKNLRDLEQLRKIIAVTHSGPGNGTGNGGINLVRVFSVVGSVDYVALEAAEWSNLISASMMAATTQSKKQSLFDFFLAIQMNYQMLRDVSDQLFHPAYRLMAAGDDVAKFVSSFGTKEQAQAAPAR
jgi:hypothetical protein